jgi:hypothetical protein
VLRISGSIASTFGVPIGVNSANRFGSARNARVFSCERGTV